MPQTQLSFSTNEPPNLVTVDQVSNLVQQAVENMPTGNGDMMKSQNLAGLTNIATARTNIGLGYVDNTSDVNKPVSTAQATAITAAENNAKNSSRASNWVPTWAEVSGKPATFTPSVHGHDWTEIANKPAFFSGSYLDLTNKPSLFDGSWASLSGKPATFAPSAHGHDWAEVTGKPAFFSGSYADLTNKPASFTPAAHSHVIGDVTNLATELANKQGVSTELSALVSALSTGTGYPHRTGAATYVMDTPAGGGGGGASDTIWGLSSPAPWQIDSANPSFFVVEYSPQVHAGNVINCPYGTGKPGTTSPTGSVQFGDLYNSPRGALSMLTGTLATGWALVQMHMHNTWSSSWGFWPWTNGKRFAAWGIYSVPVAPDDTEDFEFLMAWDDGLSGGVKAVYNKAGIAIRITTSSSVATESAHVAAPTIGSKFRLGLMGTVGGDVSLYLNGVVVATLNTGWGTQPTTVNPSNYLKKIAGTTTRRWNVYKLGHAIEN